MIERDLRYWRARRATAQVIPPPADCPLVRFGATVTIEREDGRSQVWRIVGEDEADPKARHAVACLAAGAGAHRQGGGRHGQIADGEAEIIASTDPSRRIGGLAHPSRLPRIMSGVAPQDEDGDD